MRGRTQETKVRSFPACCARAATGYPAAAAPRQAGDEARTDGIGDAREHGADAAAETRLSCEQNSYFSGYWEPRRPSDGTVGAALNRPDSRIAPVSAETGGGHVDQHEERRAREG